LRPHLRTSFHHQPEAQHPISSAIHKRVGRLPHLWVIRDLSIHRRRSRHVRFAPKADKSKTVSAGPLCADFVAEVAEEETAVGAELEA
jgi:hypothetical protein